MKLQLFGTMIKWNTEVCENTFLPIHCNMELNVGCFLWVAYMWALAYVLKEAYRCYPFSLERDFINWYSWL
jgi:hypothetical protein